MTKTRFQNLSRRFGGIRAMDGLSARLPEGSFTALPGPPGCGKFTFLRLIAGLERPGAGSLWLGGELAAGPRRFVEPEAGGWHGLSILCAFMTAINELAPWAVLWSAGNETISVQIFSLQYEGNSTAAAAQSVLALAAWAAGCRRVPCRGGWRRTGRAEPRPQHDVLLLPAPVMLLPAWAEGRHAALRNETTDLHG